MYIQITVDLKNYHEPPIELRLSDQYTVKKLVDIVWQTKKISVAPREGYWIRQQNKKHVCKGTEILKDCGITTGDKLEIL
ncbi:EsaB/YukD family protein [Salirhabdus sp. Marseille-P4669]|uniref:EsaB/YukD family protein n=1 Tax=Salirhabdus sp. Marseille-P4669 TaxID=2042310 RepID=UPI000C7D3626|nr:EsaB/YukD family protein [Salirhabdus sp. Marseille-P4669]